MATILRGPLLTGQQRKQQIGPALVAGSLLVTTAAPLPPPGVQLYASAPRIAQRLGVMQVTNLQTNTLAPSTVLALPLNAGIVNLAAPVKKSYPYSQFPNLQTTTLAPSNVPLPLSAAVIKLPAPPPKRPVFTTTMPPNMVALGINPNAQVMQWTASAPQAKRQNTVYWQVNSLPLQATTVRGNIFNSAIFSSVIFKSGVV